MAVEYSLRVAVRLNGRSDQEVYKTVNIAYDALEVWKPAFGASVSMVNPVDGDVDSVALFVTLLADDREELETAVGALLNALSNFGLDVEPSVEIRSEREVEPVQVRTQGLRYEEESKALTIETWAPDAADIELSLFVSKGDIVATIVDYTGGVRQEQAVLLKKLVIRRPAGGLPDESQLPSADT